MANRQQVDPLRSENAIVDKDGRPLPDFARRFNAAADNSRSIDADLETKADKETEIVAGAGLTGGGDLSEDRTLAVGAGTGIAVNANDVAIDLTAEAERIRDTMGTALVAGTGITVTPNDGLDTITIASTVVGFTDEAAQDAVGGILNDSASIDFTYDDGAGTITAIVKAGSIGPTELASTAVAAAAYGDATHVGQFTVDADGRITGASNVAISASGSGGVLPLVDGSVPPVFIQNPDGSLIYTPI